MKFPTYRHVLNDMIDETAGRTSNYSYGIGPSQIGASHWTAAEKDALFRKLAICGAGDLHSLSASLGTKSEAEINVYLKLLQDGVLEARATLPSEQNASATDVPSAYEVGPLCEAELESAAGSLKNVDQSDEPAIFRSAFEDFYNIAVSLTRRLVQATIFQTMTRLRASDGSRMAWTPEPLVREKDVKTAVDILGM
ncbi:hypothetical protein EJ03DRAFT_267457, partial [Teratosphaeria nubilosa]